MNLFDQKNNERIVAHGMVEGMEGELFHFKQIDKGMYKVRVSEVFDGLIELYWVTNENDYPPPSPPPLAPSYICKMWLAQTPYGTKEAWGCNKILIINLDNIFHIPALVWSY